MTVMAGYYSLSASEAAQVVILGSGGSGDNTDQFTLSVDFGDPGDYSDVLIGFYFRDDSTSEIVDSMEIDGNFASVRHARTNDSGGNRSRVELWSLRYSAGGVHDVVVTLTGPVLRGATVVWGVPMGLTSHVPTDVAGSTSNPATDAVDIQAGGFTIVIASSVTTQSGSATPVGVNEDADFPTEGNLVFGGSLNTEEAQEALSVGCDFSTGVNQVMAAAAFR